MIGDEEEKPMLTPHILKLPITDQIVFHDESRYQCERCGWTGTDIKKEWKGRQHVIFDVICSQCGNKCDFNDLFEWKIYLIPKKTNDCADRAKEEEP